MHDTLLYRIDLERLDGNWAIAAHRLVDRRADTVVAPAPALRAARSTTASRSQVRSAPPRRTIVVPDVPAELRKIFGRRKPNRNPGKGRKK